MPQNYNSSVTLAVYINGKLLAHEGYMLSNLSPHRSGGSTSNPLSFTATSNMGFVAIYHC